MVSVQNSRFALLHLEDDDKDDRPSSRSQPKHNVQEAKKKNKKKKGNAGPVKPTAVERPAPAASAKHGKAGAPHVSDEQWDEWVKADEQFSDKKYEEELQIALQQSRLDYEKEKQHDVAGKASRSDPAVNGASQKKQKKNRTQKSSVSLEEFQKMGSTSDIQKHQEDKSRDGKAEQAARKSKQDSNSEPTSGDKKQFFDDVEKDVAEILQREHNQEYIQKKFSAESAVLFRCQEQMTLKDQEINRLTDENEKLQTELASVKKRNQQLAMIIGEGEMKDKAKVVKELEDLRQEKEDLSREVASLVSELEKERSKNKGSKK